MTLLGGCVGMGKMTSFASACYNCFVRMSNGVTSLAFSITGGQQWVSMETKASRKEIGCSMVRVRHKGLGPSTRSCQIK